MKERKDIYVYRTCHACTVVEQKRESKRKIPDIDESHYSNTDQCFQFINATTRTSVLTGEMIGQVHCFSFKYQATTVIATLTR